MRIECREKGTEAFYRETVCISSMFRALIQDPERPLKDIFRQLITYMITGAALLIMLAVIGAVSGWSALMILAVVVVVLMTAASAFFYITVKRTVRIFLAGQKPSVLTLNRQGVKLERNGGQTMQADWDMIAFVRVFEECICFMGKHQKGFMISVNRKYEDQVMRFFSENEGLARVIR